MSNQEKNICVSLISAIIMFALYGVYMFEMYQEGRFDGADASSLVGKSVFVLIGVSIVVSIIVQIVFSILHSIATKECEHSISDERDKLIELKGMQVFSSAFGIGFVGSMGALAMGTAPYMVFCLITFSMFVGSVVGDIAKLFFYHRGV